MANPLSVSLGLSSELAELIGDLKGASRAISDELRDAKDEARAAEKALREAEKARKKAAPEEQRSASFGVGQAREKAMESRRRVEELTSRREQLKETQQAQKQQTNEVQQRVDAGIDKQVGRLRSDIARVQSTVTRVASGRFTAMDAVQLGEMGKMLSGALARRGNVAGAAFASRAGSALSGLAPALGLAGAGAAALAAANQYFIGQNRDALQLARERARTEERFFRLQRDVSLGSGSVGREALARYSDFANTERNRLIRQQQRSSVRSSLESGLGGIIEWARETRAGSYFNQMSPTFQAIGIGPDDVRAEAERILNRDLTTDERARGLGLKLESVAERARSGSKRFKTQIERDMQKKWFGSARMTGLLGKGLAESLIFGYSPTINKAFEEKAREELEKSVASVAAQRAAERENFSAHPEKVSQDFQLKYALSAVEKDRITRINQWNKY